MKNKILWIFLLSSFIYAKEILLLHSYHKGYDWSDSISSAVEDYYKNQNVEITTEYMDTKRVYSDSYEKQLLNLYKTKYKTSKFDLIIASDNNALNFLDKYHNKIFQNIPIVFCGINNFDKETFSNSNIFKRSTGVTESVDIKKNIELILKLHPKTKKILVLNDTTTTGLAMKKQFLESYEIFKDRVNIEYVDKFKIEELKDKIKRLDKNTVILFMLLFKDETGKVFTFKDGLKEIERSTHAPIYGLWDFYLKYGLVGGYLTHGYAQGQHAARISSMILDGTDISTLKVITKSPNSYIFDHRKLKVHNIKNHLLPKESIVTNKPFNFYEEYKYEIIVVIILFSIFVTIIFLLILSLIEKRKAKEELKLQLGFIETLLNTITNPIFYKDKNGHYLGCNEAFCEFIGKPKDEILGRTMFDFFGDQKEFLQAHDEIEHKLLNNEKVGEYIMDYKMSEDDIRTMLINKKLYHGLNGNIQGILTVLHDITDFVKAEKDKKQHESFLAQRTKLEEIGGMISAIAHQWNEPLVEMSAIVQDLELQYKTSSLSNNDIESFVSDSMVQIQYMSKTLKDFRDFLKPSVKKSYFSIQEAFEEVMNILERQIKYSYIDLSMSFSGDEIRAYGYKNEFMQVLITIINNAKDAITNERNNNENLKGEIEIFVSSNIDRIKIAIKDNGCGIKSKDKIKVFDPYFSTKSNGNGIGLYMSKVLINDKMDGKIYFSDNEKQTELIIELPNNQQGMEDENFIT
jgi:PAS domain S-box-containing protein